LTVAYGMWWRLFLLLNKSEHSDRLRYPRLFLHWLDAWSFLKNPANDQMD